MPARAAAMAMDWRMMMAYVWACLGVEGVETSGIALSQVRIVKTVVDTTPTNNGKLGKCFFYISLDLVEALPFPIWPA